jgi:two-component system cell cycle response regulator
MIPEFEILRNLPSGVIVTDSEHRIIFVNDTFLLWNKRSSSEFIDAKIFHCFPVLQEEAYFMRLRLLMIHGSPVIFSAQLHGNIFNCRKPNGLNIVEYTTVVRTDFNGKPIAIYTIQDHTEIHMLLEKNAIAKSRMEEALAKQTRVEKKLRKLNIKLKQSARTDFLTQIPNRKAILDKMRYEKTRSKRKGNTFSLIIGDIDNFKSFNDGYGHECGDLVLKTTAQILTTHIREQDLVARWGGEEFLLFLPETGIDGALSLAEKLRSEIADHKFNFRGQKLQITITFGLSEYRIDEKLYECIHRADSALYLGKKKKNTVMAG